MWSDLAAVLDAGQGGGNQVKPEQIAQQVQQAGKASEGSSLQVSL